MDNQLNVSGISPQRVSQSYCQTIALLWDFVCVLRAIAGHIKNAEKNRHVGSMPVDRDQAIQLGQSAAKLGIVATAETSSAAQSLPHYVSNLSNLLPAFSRTVCLFYAARLIGTAQREWAIESTACCQLEALSFDMMPNASSASAGAPPSRKMRAQV